MIEETGRFSLGLGKTAEECHFDLSLSFCSLQTGSRWGKRAFRKKIGKHSEGRKRSLADFIEFWSKFEFL